MARTRCIDSARVCVEMNLTNEFPSYFLVETEFNENFEVRVQYAWTPKTKGETRPNSKATNEWVERIKVVASDPITSVNIDSSGTIVVAKNTFDMLEKR